MSLKSGHAEFRVVFGVELSLQTERSRSSSSSRVVWREKKGQEDEEVEEQFEDKDENDSTYDCNTYDCSRFLGHCGICGRGPDLHGYISESKTNQVTKVCILRD